MSSSPPSSCSSQSSILRPICKFLLLLTLSSVIVAAIFLGAAFHGAHRFLHHAAEVIVPQITSDIPLDLPPPVLLSEKEERDVTNRIHQFKEILHHGTTPVNDLELSEREINGLFCSKGEDNLHLRLFGGAVRGVEGQEGPRHKHPRHHHHRDMCGKVHVTVSKNQLSADFSFPVDEHFPGGRGRYATGTKLISIVSSTNEVTDSSAGYYLFRTALGFRGGVWDSWDEEAFPVFDVSGLVQLFDNGAVDMRAESAEVLGWSATDIIVRRFLEGKNLAEGRLSCNHAREVWKHIAGVEIGQGKVVVRARR